MLQKEIQANQDAWGKLSEDHYQVFSEKFRKGEHHFNPYIQQELGDITGKKVIHLQCNTGADTILLGKMGAEVTGVDLVPDNVRLAERMAKEQGLENARFIQANVLELAQTHKEKYDMVFVSEGAIGWLPELETWGKTVQSLLKDGGVFYIFDSHPFFMSMDEVKLQTGDVVFKYPYFSKEPDVEETIGGYACDPKPGVKAYFWVHTVSDIICALANAGMRIEYFHEFPENFYDSGNMEKIGDTGLYSYPFNKDKFAMSFSLRAIAE